MIVSKFEPMIEEALNVSIHSLVCSWYEKDERHMEQIDPGGEGPTWQQETAREGSTANMGFPLAEVAEGL